MSHRRSARLESKPAVTFSDFTDPVAEEDAEFDEQNMSDSDHEPPAARKRRKTGPTPSGNSGNGKRSIKGKRGRLRQLPEMPLDILYEIFGHLRPYDLLRLARTTKALRGILMRRSATSVWKDARASIEGFPDCPDDLDEPQFASLAFDPFCHYCGAPNVHTVLWACRVRSCQKCINSKFMDASEVYCRVQMYDTGRQHDTGRQYVGARDLVPWGKSRFGKYYMRQIYVTASVEDVCEKLEALNSDRISVDKYLDERKNEVMALQAHAALCELWQSQATTGRCEELRDLKERRKEAIFDKLRESGWGEELDKSDNYTLLPLTKHGLVKKPQELTDRIWSNIKPTIIDIMTELRDKRVKKERIALLKQRQKVVATLLKAYSLERPVIEVIPGPADVCDMDEFKVVIEDTPNSVEVDEASFEQAMARLPQLVDEWRAAKDAELVRIMNKETASESKTGVSISADNRTRLELATTLFSCKVCYTTISYPRILVHSCTHDLRFIWRIQNTEDPRSILWQNLGDEPWNMGGDRVGFEKRVQPTTRQVVECCQRDPDTTTAQEMDELDARLECSSCSDITGRYIMSWRVAVIHGMSSRHSNPPEWKLVDEADTLLAKQKEKENKDSEPLSYRLGPSICCARCREKTWGSHVADHLKNKHGVEEMTEDDYYRHLDAPPQGNPIRMGGSEQGSEQGMDMDEILKYLSYSSSEDSF